MRTLACQDLEVVSVIRTLGCSGGAGLTCRITLGAGLRYQASQRAGLRARRRLPIESVPLFRSADELLRIDRQTILGSPRGLGVILPLRQHIGAAGQYRGKFVLADMPVEDFFEARGGIEAPLVSVFDDGDGRRPIVVAYQECELGVTHFLELVRLLEVGGETLQSVVALHRIAGQQFGAVRTEDGGQRRLVIRFGRVRQSFDGLFGSRKAGLVGGWGLLRAQRGRGRCGVRSEWERKKGGFVWRSGPSARPARAKQAAPPMRLRGTCALSSWNVVADSSVLSSTSTAPVR